MPAKALMIQGTGSDVGKSIVVAALCRILVQDGYKVAPFKSQNMSLNSAVTLEKGEIGRAQFVQAKAAKVDPSVAMNPILLKPIADTRSQVVLNGRPHKNLTAVEYHDFKPEALEVVKQSYHDLSSNFDVVIIEGAGSPAEINLKEFDIVNMKVAEIAEAKVLLVGDIDKGGVFASFVGTLELLTPIERDRVRGFLVNKFRGDKTILDPGLRFLEKKTGKDVLGVIPHFSDIKIPEEDSVCMERKILTKSKICVIWLPHLSNFTDFDSLNVRYIKSAAELSAFGGENPEMIILPGSKSTIDDLVYLKQSGIADRIIELAKQGMQIMGICGGYQMLGRKIYDPNRVESSRESIDGLGLLNVETTILKEKITYQVKAKDLDGGRIFSGYEIHMGETKKLEGVDPLFRIIERGGKKTDILDGAKSKDGRIFGTYIHGLFDDEQGLDVELDKLANLIRENVDMEKVYKCIF